MRLALDMAHMKQVPPDSGVWVPGKNIKKVMFAIDAQAAEAFLAKELGYDLLIAHHPVGPSKLSFYKVVRRHTEFMVEKGVPRRLAEQATRELMERIEVNAHPTNYLHDVQVARKLGLAFMNIHQPIDQITREFLLEAIKRSEAKTVGELVRALGKIPEFMKAETRIEQRMGKHGDKLGEWVLVFGAGTNGGYPVAKAYFENGVDTVVYLHVEYEALRKLRSECKGNLVVLGHMAGDSIGANIFIKELKRRGMTVDSLDVVS
jgi:putative NIF3 family GTP cyclohydrolase 1 type 2